MNALLKKLEDTFQTRQRTDSEQYWSAIADSKSDPELVMTLADKMGKNLNDLREDAQLIEQFNQSTKPDNAKFKTELTKVRNKREKLNAEISKMRALLQSKSLELDTLSAQVHIIQTEHSNAEQAHQQLLKALSARGYPLAVAEVETAQQAKQERKEQLLFERRESDLLKELAQCDKDISRLAALPKLSKYDETKLAELKAKRAKLDAELTKHREHG